MARDMETHRRLKGIKFVIGISTIVKDHPYILERFGFQVFNLPTDDENLSAMTKAGVSELRRGITTEHEAYAVMSREKFLKRPWVGRGRA
jgi:hypothetical protein